MKKLLKLLVTACMLVSCFGANVFADDEPEDLLIESSDKYEGDTFKECKNFTIAEGVTLTLKNDDDKAPYISVWGDIAIEGTLVPCQDAKIRVQPGCSFAGIEFWDPTGQEKITSIDNPVDFVYLSEMEKWVQGLEDKTFDSDFNIDAWYEFGNVAIESGVTLSFTNEGYLCVRGSFTNNGTLNPVDGAIIALDNSEFEGINLYEANTITPVSSRIEGYIEFIYLAKESKWVRYIRPQDVAIEYDDEMGEVYHYEGDNLVYLQQDWKDDGEGPYRNFFYHMDGEDTFYIKAKDGYVFDHIEAEGDDPQSAEYPGNRIINVVVQDDIKIGDVDYKVVKVTTNPKDDNFYFFQFIFSEDSDAINKKLAEKLNTLELAFDSTLGKEDNYSKLKEYIANAIYERYISSGSRYHIENTMFEGDDFSTFKGKVIIVEDGTDPTKNPAQIDGKTSAYFKYRLDGLDNFIGIVYKLDGTDQFILRDGDTYTTIDVTDEAKIASEGEGAEALKDFKAVSGGKIVVRKVNNTVNKEESEEGPNYEIFGNYAGFPMNYTGLMQDSQDTHYISIERVMPCAPNSIDTRDFSGLGCEMILYSNNFLGVSVKSDENAKPWSQDNLPIYPTNSNNEEATVFYASKSVEIASAYGAPTSSEIKNVTFSNGKLTWNDCSVEGNEGGPFTINLGSIFYDKVPLEITYTNGITKSFVIARTGISIGDYPAPGDGDSVDVYGVTVNFTDENRWLIAAPFYYDNSSPDRVSLFVKITDNNGLVSTKLISNPINNSIKDDESGDTYSKYDVFELWRGKENNRPQVIEVIAFVSGDEDSFGGVKLGSGSGIKWTRERGRQ